MGGIDLLLSRNLSRNLKEELDEEILSSVEKDLFFQHGMSIKLSIEHFEKFHSILKQHSEFDPNEIEKQCLKKLIEITQVENDFLIKVISTCLAEMIFNYFGDEETRKILVTIMNNPLTVPEILDISGVLKSPAYRKIENLLLDGMILESGKILTNNKRVSQYRCVFDKVTFVLDKGRLSVEVIVNGKYFKQSSLYKSGLMEPRY
jgi:hypothetical protein